MSQCNGKEFSKKPLAFCELSTDFQSERGFDLTKDMRIEIRSRLQRIEKNAPPLLTLMKTEKTATQSTPIFSSHPHYLTINTPAKIGLTTACARHVDSKNFFSILIGSVCAKFNASMSFCLVRSWGLTDVRHTDIRASKQ